MKYFSEEEEDYNRSLSKFEGMLRTNKVLFFDSEEFEDIVLHYLDLGKVNLAKKALKLALDQHPNSTGLKLVQVELLVFEDKLELAEKIVNELVILEPANEEAYIQKANVFSKKGMHEKAVEQLEIALQYTDDLADVYNILGMEYLYMDCFEDAKKYFLKCIEVDIEDQEALYNVVYCFEFLDQNQAAIDFLTTYIDKKPFSEIAWHQIGRLQYGLKNYQEAVRAFEFATYIDDAFMGAFMELAKSFERLKNYEAAIENYSKTLYLDDATSYALLRIGKCYERLGNKPLALKFFYKTVHEDPLLDKAWKSLTDFYVREKNYSKALLNINKALAIDDKNGNYWKRFANINIKIDQLDDAEFGYRKAVECGDLNLDTWLNWIDLIFCRGEYDMAIGTLILASEYFPDNEEIEFRLAGLYFLLQKNVKAKFHLKNGMQINFEGIGVLKKLYPLVWDMAVVQDWIAKHKNNF
jgi:tetratricopeptide (TPR) repeat protein